MVLHDVREKLGLPLSTYAIVDSVHKLSTINPGFPYCVMSKKGPREIFDLSESTVYRALNQAEEKGLIERCEFGLRATDAWVRSVEMFSIHKRRWGDCQNDSPLYK
ncbi:MAG: hypothetical protein AAFU49_07100 [Pseudomonadota bacterium]